MKTAPSTFFVVFTARHLGIFFDNATTMCSGLAVLLSCCRPGSRYGCFKQPYQNKVPSAVWSVRAATACGLSCPYCIWCKRESLGFPPNTIKWFREGQVRRSFIEWTHLYLYFCHIYLLFRKDGIAPRNNENSVSVNQIPFLFVWVWLKGIVSNWKT